MKKVLLLMSLACLFAGCKTFGGSNGETLKLLETTTVVRDLSGNIINIEVVPLTSDSVLLGNVSKLVITPSGYALLHGGGSLRIRGGRKFPAQIRPCRPRPRRIPKPQ